MTIPRKPPVTCSEMAVLFENSGYNVSKLGTMMNEPRHMCDKWLRDYNIQKPTNVGPFADWIFDDVKNILVTSKKLIVAEQYVKNTYKSTGSVPKYFEIHKFDWKQYVRRPQGLPCPLSKTECVSLLLTFGFKYHKIYQFLKSIGLQGKPFNRWIKEHEIDVNELTSIVDQLSISAAISDIDNPYSIAKILSIYMNDDAISAFRVIHQNSALFSTINTSEIAATLNVPVKKVLDYKNAFDIPDMIRSTSIQEQDLKNMIHATLGINGENKRFSINGVTRELDIYLREHNVGIEFNGSYWHCADFIPPNYHIKKTELFKTVGIDVIHVFDFDPPQAVLSILANKLNKPLDTIHAANCDVRRITTTLAEEFCKINHIQRSVNCSLAYGLYDGDSLVYVITFGKPRFDTHHKFEILRVCPALFTNVVGGFSKVFSAFLQNHDGDVITCANLRYGNGDIFPRTEFKFMYQSSPNYFYSNGVEYKNRHECQHLLIEHPAETEETEETIMRKRGYFKIHDCGNNVFEYTR